MTTPQQAPEAQGGVRQRGRHVFSDDERAVLEELGLPAVAPGAQATAVTEVLAVASLARTDKKVRALFLAGKGDDAPAMIAEREDIAYHQASVGRSSLGNAPVTALESEGYTVIPYLKGFLVTIDREA